MSYLYRKMTETIFISDSDSYDIVGNFSAVMENIVRVPTHIVFFFIHLNYFTIHWLYFNTEVSISD